ncbi:hypothetical protein FB451DRAFT_1391942 [Mycena latifolia]|nr:hypothetical protein FB451DRAFT_1391942 [Mycena latifolia]
MRIWSAEQSPRSLSVYRPSTPEFLCAEVLLFTLCIRIMICTPRAPTPNFSVAVAIIRACARSRHLRVRAVSVPRLDASDAGSSSIAQIALVRAWRRPSRHMYSTNLHFAALYQTHPALPTPAALLRPLRSATGIHDARSMPTSRPAALPAGWTPLLPGRARPRALPQHPVRLARDLIDERGMRASWSPTLDARAARMRPPPLLLPFCTHGDTEGAVYRGWAARTPPKRARHRNALAIRSARPSLASTPRTPAYFCPGAVDGVAAYSDSPRAPGSRVEELG